MLPLTLIIGNKNYSSWSLRPWLAMHQMAVPFTEIRLPLDTPEFYAQIERYSPSRRVPALRQGDWVIWESLAICEYVAELFPDRPWYPADPQVRAIARAVSHEMHAGFAKLRTHMPMDVRSRYPGKGRAPGVQADIDRITSLWRECRSNYGSEGEFLFGGFGIADAMYAPVVSRFVTYGVALDPVCQADADAVWALPSMQAWITDAQQETEVLTHP
ncbi:glutathione S-transferase family protein [Leptolyngbya sp. O-77]|uniref:glutathione S-transferase family protein n=1 Tax=Leptolyngbya sp. O-77 TaxID=1080068 RepID=UPI00074D3DCE|nr:glutathione S-transferase family protein [Leptolyngbya sp. O-77]BAU41645.1 Glutathione S-transferase YfcF [Leptolyngbya sp. O-77]